LDYAWRILAKTSKATLHYHPAAVTASDLLQKLPPQEYCERVATAKAEAEI